MENEDLTNIFAKTIEENEFMKMMGLEAVEVRRGYAKCRIKMDKKFCNPYGTLHGGMLYSLADITAGFAACSYGPKAVTVDGDLHFLNPAIRTEYVYCEAKEQRRGNDLSVFGVEIMSDRDKILDTGTFTYFNIH